MPNFVDDLFEAMDLSDAEPELLAEFGLGALGTSPAARHRRRQQKLTNAVLRQALRRIDDAFGDLSYILLKGEPLERLLFDEYTRCTGDIDLLVLPGDIEACRRHLEALGYRRKRDEPPRMWAHNQEPWVHDNHGVVVELHWSTSLPGTPALPLADLFSTRVPFEFDDALCVDVLREDWLFFHLVLHFHHHQGFAKGLVDIAAWCDRYGADVDADAMLERARSLGMFGFVQWPLHTLAILTGATPPLYRDDVDMPTRMWAVATARALRDCLSTPPGGDLEATLVAIMPRVGTLGAVSLQALTMLNLDDWPSRLRGVLRRSIMGPHRLGGFLDRSRRRFRR